MLHHPDNVARRRPNLPRQGAGRLLAASLTALAVLIAPLPGRFAGVNTARACPYCSVSQTKSLAEEVAESAIVIHGTFGKVTPAVPEGTTELKVISILRDHELLTDKKLVIVPKEFPSFDRPGSTGPAEYVLFAQVVDGKMAPFRLIEVNDPRIVPYMKDSVAHQKKPATERLPFFFQYLDHPNPEIANDAYKAFAVTPFADVLQAAKGYDPAKLRQWLGDRNTPAHRIGLFSVLLGVCGTREDGKLIERIIDSPELRPLSGVDGLMGGYCLLDPVAGVDYTVNALVSEKSDFNLRYAALRTIRINLKEFPNLDRAKMLAALDKAIERNDIADLVIDEIRLLGRFEDADKVLALWDRQADQAMVRRAVIRFALRCPGDAAKQLLSKIRATEPHQVTDQEDLLKYEDQLRELELKPYEKKPADAAKPADKPTATGDAAKAKAARN